MGIGDWGLGIGSENAEYDAAKDEQRDIEARITEIEKILKDVEVVDEDEIDVNTINIGCTVTMLDMEYDEQLTFRLVGSSEANSLDGKISNESPIGMAMLGKSIGDEIAVETPDGESHFRILMIEKTV